MAEPFKPHPNLSDDINRNIVDSELEGGVYLKDLPMGTTLHVRTKNTAYTLFKDFGTWYISGHATYCPEPRAAHIHGSTWGGSMIKVGFVGRGMHMEFTTDEHPGIIVTSTILDITEVK
jgi:hypothetical protein